MPSLDVEPLTLESVEILTVTYEIRAAVNEAVLPPGLHPTIPPIVTFVVWRTTGFSLAQVRIGCRSGMRPRAFLVSAVLDGVAAPPLAERWGFAIRPGAVELTRSYDRIRVRVDGGNLLDVDMVDPSPLRPGDIQWIANMNLAQTPRGLRLVQVDPDYAVTRAERGRPRLHHFDASAWGEPLLEPVHPVVATFAVADVTLPRLRFVCRPDVLAFFGTEPAVEGA
jgi:hypothetical protein